MLNEDSGLSTGKIRMEKQMVRHKLSIASTALVLSMFATPALAYIDPGNGAMLVQAFLALVASAVFYFRNPSQLWRDLKNWFIRNRKP